MAEKFKKIDKEFLLTDSSLNSYGYRLLTPGYLLDEFKKNPIGYWMHGTEEYPREAGVLVKWEDFRLVGDKVYAKPCINLNHPRGQRTADEIESGFLNAASCGHFVVLEISEDPADYLDGQKGVSVSKWFNRECSLVDIPGNFNALTDLFDENNNPLKLEDLTAKQNIPVMKQIILTADQLGLLNLKADSDPAAVSTALSNLVAEAAKVPGLTQELAAERKKVTDKEVEIANLQAAQAEKEVTDLLDKALNTDKKITKETSDKLAVTYKGKPTELKDLLATMTPIVSITDKIKQGQEKNATKLEALKAKSFSELDQSGELADLKALSLEDFKAKWKEHFGKDYNG